MSEKEASAIIADILQAIATIQNYTTGLNEESFSTNHLVSDAVIRQMALIGEAASQMPDAFRQSHPQIEWRKIIGMRNRIVHAYDEINYSILWSAVQTDLPALKTHLQSIRSD